MKKHCFPLLFVVSLFAASAHADQPRACTGPQIGTWKIQSFTSQDVATSKKTNLFGPHPSGAISYAADCRMSLLFVRDDRKPPTSAVATESEKAALYDGMVAYAGDYTIMGNQVSHHVDTSWNQQWVGTTLVRDFKVEGDMLYVKTKPSKGFADGKETVYELVFKKVS